MLCFGTANKPCCGLAQPVNYAMVWHSQDATLMVHFLSATSKWRFFVYICYIQICVENVTVLTKCIGVELAKGTIKNAEYSYHTLLVL
jgi:hypothetical protein